MIEYFTILILDDKEVAMIDRMLGGKRAEGCSAYEHLALTCNIQDSTIRAYVRLGKEVDGHPVSFRQGGCSARHLLPCSAAVVATA